MKFLFSIIAFVALAESCNSAKDASTQDATAQRTTMEQTNPSTTYIITEIKGVSDISEELSITLDSKTNKVNGFSGCNTFFGNYTIDGNQIEFGPLATTKKFCKQDQSRLEQQFLETLSEATLISTADNALTLSDDAGQLISAKAKVSDTPSKSDVVQDNYNQTTITYQAMSRGQFEYVQISKSEVLTSTDRNLKSMNSYSCKTEDWEAIEALLNSIAVENLNQLKAPTDKRLFDGAAHATLSITKGDILMTTPSFDHGSPPKEIEALVNKVLSIAENRSKD